MIDPGLIKMTCLHTAFCIMWLTTLSYPFASWGNVLGYIGNTNSSGAALSVGSGASASVIVGIGFKMPLVVPLKLEDSPISSIEGKAYNSGPGKPFSVSIQPLKQGLNKNSIQLVNESNEISELLLVNNKIQETNQQNMSQFKFQGEVSKGKRQSGNYQGEVTLSLTSL